MSEEDPGLVGFAERCLALLDRGSFSATYKYAVLLGLMDLCLEKTDQVGEPPERVTVEELARKVIELYWPQTVGFKSPDRLLRQNNRGQAEIVLAIRTFREQRAADPLAPLARARLASPEGFLRLLREVEWKLIEMPLPKLHRVGNTRDTFLYAIGWDDKITRSAAFAKGFDRSLRLRPGVAQRLCQLAGLLRPLLQREWASMVARFNTDQVDESTLEEFLFGRDRISTEPVREDLRELQHGRCFYCEKPAGKEGVVDHFLPWARYPNNAIENLVVADQGCNGNKRDFLAAPEHVERWKLRRGQDLKRIARDRKWESAVERTEGVVRALYLRLPEGAKLWRGRKDFVAVDLPLLRRALDG